MGTTVSVGGCGFGPCFSGASHIIFKGMAGHGTGLVVGFFYHQIRIDCRDSIGRPGGVAGPIPAQRPDIDQDTSDYNKVEVDISIKWPFIDKWQKMTFIMERKWANVIVNRINQINTFNENFNVAFTNFKDGFEVKFKDFKGKFGVKWKK